MAAVAVTTVPRQRAVGLSLCAASEGLCHSFKSPETAETEARAVVCAPPPQVPALQL